LFIVNIHSLFVYISNQIRDCLTYRETSFFLVWRKYISSRWPRFAKRSCNNVATTKHSQQSPLINQEKEEEIKQEHTTPPPKWSEHPSFPTHQTVKHDPLASPIPLSPICNEPTRKFFLHLCPRWHLQPTGVTEYVKKGNPTKSQWLLKDFYNNQWGIIFLIFSPICLCHQLVCWNNSNHVVVNSIFQWSIYVFQWEHAAEVKLS